MKLANSLVASICVRTSFEGFHRYPEAPDEVAFLRNLHRHVFGVLVCVQVSHDDRDVEFFMLKHDLDSLLASNLLPELERNESKSCEMLARELWLLLLARGYHPTKIEISEDDENYALLEAK